MHTEIKKVCRKGIFGSDSDNFWMGELGIALDSSACPNMPCKNEFYTVVFVDDAIGGSIHIESQRFSLSGSQVCIIAPDCITSIQLNNNPSGTMICFTEEFLASGYNNNLLSRFDFLTADPTRVFALTASKAERFSNLCRLMQDEFASTEAEKVSVLSSYLNIVLFELERICMTGAMKRKPDHRSIKVMEFKKLIELHHSRLKLPSAYASILNVTANYLNKLCREETGMTAGDLIRKHIVIESKRKLLFTDHTVSQIADELGYDSPSYFITFFKKQTKVTPEQFRKQN